jgi:hypothetical protein
VRLTTSDPALPRAQTVAGTRAAKGCQRSAGSSGPAATTGGRDAAKYLDEALRYILGHDGVWSTTADDIAEYYIANHYDGVMDWIAEQKAQT